MKASLFLILVTSIVHIASSYYLRKGENQRSLDGRIVMSISSASAETAIYKHSKATKLFKSKSTKIFKSKATDIEAALILESSDDSRLTSSDQKTQFDAKAQKVSTATSDQKARFDAKAQKVSTTTRSKTSKNTSKPKISKLFKEASERLDQPRIFNSKQSKASGLRQNYKWIR